MLRTVRSSEHLLDTDYRWKDYFDFVWTEPHDSKILHQWIVSKLLTNYSKMIM